MALYYPPLFCGPGTTLKAIKDFEIESENGDIRTVAIGDKCVVDDIKGYGHDIKIDNTEIGFRILNSSMPAYFEIIDKVEPEYDLGDFDYHENEGSLATLIKDFEIKNVVTISAGQQFLSFLDAREDGVFYDLFSVANKARILRMKESEFREYCNKLNRHL